MPKAFHEIRDPIHVFVRLTSDERQILDSRPFQRLRHIHQLALTYLIYPGATHRRFEHSLGVMELAGRVYDVITRPENVAEQVRSFLPELNDTFKREYWRRAVRMAALCHDLGHLPFSHAAEKQLLPEGLSHEYLTAAVIRSPDMRASWEAMRLNPEDIVKLALGPKEVAELKGGEQIRFTAWETILSEVIVGDAFGVDRMDYLLRDSHHAGVAYGRFDHYRLIDTLRILPPAQAEPGEPALGIEEGGIQSAEGLMLARYFMYSQVYFHPIRRIYDIHLQDFLSAWLEGGRFQVDVAKHLQITDNEVSAAILAAATDEAAKGHVPARCIVGRGHYRPIYERNPDDIAINPEAAQAVFEALKQEFGPDAFRYDRYRPKAGAPDFPVKRRDDSIVSSLAISEALRRVPVVSADFVFADPSIAKKATEWMKSHKPEIVKPRPEGGIP
jgi:HD superfamily phosphohydrolase